MGTVLESGPVLPADGELPSGTRVGDFVIESKLGKGAFGTVYKAENPVIGKRVAIKVLARKYSVDEEIVDRFIAEAWAVNQIGHKNIIDIFSFGELDDGRRYYAMEYLDGETLQTRLEREGKLALADALPILRAIGRALDAAHAKGIAHRDLKPENVFLGNDDGGLVVKLLDFGIAKLLGPDDGMRAKTRTGAPIGTPYYMSPEQCRGRDVDHRTDFYAFGILTYQLLTGTYPIDGEDHMTIMMAQISDTPAPPSSKVPELSEAVDEVVLWLMEKEPARRPPDLATAVRALEDAASKAGFAVRRSAPAAPTIVPLRRSRAKWIIVVALVTVGVLGAATYSAMQSSRPHVEEPVPVVEPKPEPPAPVPIPVAPSDVAITITNAPADTKVTFAGEVIGTVPTVRIPKGTTPVTLTFESPAHEVGSVEVTPDRDREIPITLTKPKAPAKGRDVKKRDSRGIESPFR